MPKTKEAIQILDPQGNIIVDVQKAGDGTEWIFHVRSKLPRTRADMRRLLNAFLTDLTEVEQFAVLDRHMQAGPALHVLGARNPGIAEGQEFN